MKALNKLFKKYRIHGYIIPKNDEYFNEYVSSSNDRLKFISNFSGSAGFALILENKNYLFVDGRYTIQARYQSGNKFKIITIPNKFPKDVLKFKKKIVIGFDPKLHTEKQLNILFKIKNINLKSINSNLIDSIWSNKPKEKLKPFFLLSQKNTGASSSKKLKQVKDILLKNKTDYLLVTAPENVAWILNIRGHDSSYSPIPNARLLVSKKGLSYLFANLKKTKKIKSIAARIYDEKKIEIILNRISKKNIWLDTASCPFFYKNLLKRKNKIIDKLDPTYFFKSI
jgi:Creatinase/Prolidase N-terminal domain.